MGLFSEFKLLRPVTAENFQDAVNFLVPLEHQCVTLMSQLSENGRAVFPEGQYRFFFLLGGKGKQNEYDGVLYLTRTGMLLHVFKKNTDIESYRKEIGRLCSKHRIYCIMGDTGHTSFLEQLVNRNISYAVNYQLMTITDLDELCFFSPSSIIIDGYSPGIRQCTSADAELLLPLQGDMKRKRCFFPAQA
ncbi:hypothetical protein K7I13_11920 [Brucepastera parasyntrophica]|uniref:hypothetical protein n=1 Tax=Brucepastera parasyntrophica TaxID=2880008 RepID=UPI00210E42EB|nr:hypothetical protein [Brucepastera parasyntrophica]ULQ59195.1 hypothetical protein K7I13_11920 [Brucepastera parasyntrophica]